MRLSTKGKYGVKALFELAMHEGAGPVSLKTIADRQGLSEHYLEQLAAPLRKAGLLTSVRGAQGGYTLSRPATEITLGDIIRVLEGPIGFTDCSVEGESTPKDPMDCVIHNVWSQVTAEMVRVLDGVSLHDLVEQAQAQRTATNFVYQI